MLIDWTDEFDRWLDTLEAKAADGDAYSRQVLDLVLAQLQLLEELPGPPLAETPALRWIRRSGRFEIWRVSHPFRPGIAVRSIVWFHGDGVVVLWAVDKVQFAEVFYDNVGARADQLIELWLRRVRP